MKKKKIFIILIVLIILAISIFYIFFRKNTAKNLKIGNNTTSQEIVDYILNISSYEAKIDVEIISNKNRNKYILKQQYIKPNTNIQEVMEPSNIEGVKIIKNGENLKLENTKLNLTTFFENYKCVAENNLDLSSFIKDYKENENVNWEEENNAIVMKVDLSNSNRYNKTKVLFVDKNTGDPIKMEIKDASKNVIIYILYNEVKLNSANK